MTSRETVEQFITALRRHEDDGDIEPLLAMFTDDARIETATGTSDLRGADGARALWAQDRDVFASVSSDFHTIIVDGDHAALEWRREAEGPDGTDRSHAGVSVLDVQDGLVGRFGVYFDPTALGAAGG